LAEEGIPVSGNSMPEGKPYAIEKIVEINPSTILDVGAGRGAYATILFPYLPKARFDAVEVWEPYIEQYRLHRKYNNVFNIDAREHDDFDYDLVIFGDVLEHMSKEDALKIWERVSKQARFALISIPIVHMPQDEIDGNPYEVHEEEDWSTELVLKEFSNIVEYRAFEQTGVFIAYFGENNG
jgi:cyclopropane fatty-acyl-phospholipid synthase-like methyltransferase